MSAGSRQAAQRNTPTRFLPTARRLLGEFRHDLGSVIGVVVLVLAGIALNVLVPIMLGQAINVIYAGAISLRFDEGTTQDEVIAQLIAEGETDYAQMLSGTEFIPGAGIDFLILSRYIMVILLMVLGSESFDFFQGLLINRVVVRVIYRMRHRIEDQIHRVPLSYVDSRERGDLLSRSTNDVSNVQSMFQEAVTGLIRSVLLLTGITVMMFVLSWKLALIALIALPVAAGLVIGIGTKAQKLYATQWRETGALNSHVEESITGHHVVTVFARTDSMRERFDEHNEEVFKASFAAEFYSGLIMPIMQWVNSLGYVGIAVVGGLQVASGQMTLGAVTAFIQYSRQFNTPLSELTEMTGLVMSGVASAERIYEFLDAEPEADEALPADRELPAPGTADGHIRFEDVEFSYPAPEGEEKTPLIGGTDGEPGLNLEAHPGQMVAIVGPTGAGKTTLVNLIMRFYDVDSGRILVDGQDITDLPRAVVRSQIGMVLQDAVLFEGTIAENIRYGRLDATDEEVRAAAEATSVDRVISTLPDGYDTTVGSEGSSLSAGERQLITIARAFLKNPSVLILDEATSSVDTRTEKLIQHAMGALRSQRTSFVIAHRLSTIRDADLIVVMREGAVVEQGTHEDLVAAGGAYWELLNSSALTAGGADDPEPDENSSPTGNS